MPGPGGGARGGGFSGGSRGGGFSGGHRPSHHTGGHFHRPPRHMGWYPSRRYRSYGGGCSGGIAAIVIVIICIIGSVAAFFSDNSAYSHNSVQTAENGIIYDEKTFQDYANSRYAEHFSLADDYEENILLVFLANEECDDYYSIAWVGDNLKKEVRDMFGNEYTEYGIAMTSSISSDYYGYSLSSSLADVIDTMRLHIVPSEESSVVPTQTQDIAPVKSELVNYTAMPLNKDTVDRALQDFTAATDIPIVIVVDYMTNVFDSSHTSSETAIIGSADGPTSITLRSSIPIALIILLVIALVVTIIVVIKKKKKNNEEEDDYTLTDE